MLVMEQVEEIRRLEGQGVTCSAIAKRLGVSRPTVMTYADQEDFVVPCPVSGRGSGPSILDPLKPVIDGILKQDKLVWRKQRHTAKRVWERLRDEHGFMGQYSLVQRYVKAWKEADRLESDAGGFNVLVWEPGITQIDFGEADFEEPWGVSRLAYLVVSFPASNQGFTQVFRGETAECVCQGMKDVFMFIGGVSPVSIFDNAAGVGRRVGDEVRESEVFRRFRLHYRFEARWCNPYAGHEKGHVENKVGAVRRSLFVPAPRVEDLEVFNQALLVGAIDEQATHYRKQEKIAVLFAEDQHHLLPLPPREFDVVRWAEYVTDKYGTITVDGLHQYSVSPLMPHTRVIVGFRAHQVEICTVTGELVATHPRSFGKRRSRQFDQVAMMAALIYKPGAWQQSGFREMMPAGPGRDFLDHLGKRDLSMWLVGIRDQAVAHGLAETQDALDWLASHRDGFSLTDLGAVTSRVAGYGLFTIPDEGPDLGWYDQALMSREAVA